jgi:hypothetical protein
VPIEDLLLEDHDAMAQVDLLPIRSRSRESPGREARDAGT